MKNISEEELKKNLMLLKNMLQILDNSNLKNIKFINIFSFYDYIDKLNNNRYSVKKIMDILELYMPLSLFIGTDVISILNASLNSFNEEYINFTKKIFYKKCIMNFFNMLYEANNEKDFNTIFIAFNNIRKSSYSINYNFKH